jgi:hypothetical protein
VSIDVSGGQFIAEAGGYKPYSSGGKVGAEMSLRFKPLLGKLLTALGVATRAAIGPCAIDLIQIVREIHPAGGPLAAVAGQGLGYAARMVPVGLSQGWGIDMDWQAPMDDGFKKITSARVDGLKARIAQLLAQQALAPLNAADAAELADLQEQSREDAARIHQRQVGAVTSLDPRYAQQRLSASVPLFTTYEPEQTNGNAFVWDGVGSFPTTRFARIRDRPGIPINDPMLGMEFQVAALLETPQLPQVQRYLASVSWGWRRAAAGQAPTTDAFALVSANGVMSQAFQDAVAHWNALRCRVALEPRDRSCSCPDPGPGGKGVHILRRASALCRHARGCGLDRGVP